jgi:hypothetical protein
MTEVEFRMRPTRSNYQLASRLLSVVFPVANLLYQLGYSSRPAFASSDEGGYIAWAKVLTGGYTSIQSAVYPGYSFFLVPATLLAKTGDQLWTGILITNCICAIGVINMSNYFLKKWHPAPEPPLQLFATCVVGGYPLLVTMTNFAFPSVTSSLLVIAAVLSVWKTVETSSKSLWQCLLIITLLFFQHPTTVGICIGCIIALLVFLRMPTGKKLVLVSSFAICVYFLNKAIRAWLIERVASSTENSVSGYDFRGRIFSQDIFVGSNLWSALIHTSTLLFSLIVSTLGLLVLAAVQSWRVLHVNSTNEHDRSRRAAVIVVLIGSSFCLVATVREFGLGGFDRLSTFQIDNWIFQRYVEPVVPLILVIGVSSLGDWTRRQRLRFSIGTGLLLVPGATSLHYLMLKKKTLSGPQSANDYLLPMANGFWPQYFSINVAYWVALSLVVIPLIFFNSRKAYITCLLAIALLTATAQREWMIKFTASYSTPSALDQLVRASFERGSCVGFDSLPPLVDETQIKLANASSSDEFIQSKIDEARTTATNRSGIEMGNLAFSLTGYHFRTMDKKQWGESCNGPFFTWRPDFETDSVLAWDSYSNLYLIGNQSNTLNDVPGRPFNISVSKGDTDPCIQARCFGLSAEDLISTLGISEMHNGRIRSLGRRGLIAASKGSVLNKGTYTLSIDATGTSFDGIRILIDADAGSTLVFSGDPRQSVAEKKLLVSFKLDQWVSDLRFQIYGSDESRIEVRGIRVSSSS